MYTTARQVPAQTTVTISVSAIDGIQMPQSQAPAPMQPQQPMSQAPQAPAAAPGQGQAMPEEPPASEQAKTAFVASLEAIRQYHMATDPAEKERWKQAADNLHGIIENDGPQMMSSKFEYTALMALPKTSINVPNVDPSKPKPPKPQQAPAAKPAPPAKVKVPSTVPAQAPAGNVAPTPPGQNASSNDVRTPPNSQQPVPGKQPNQAVSEPSQGPKPKTPGVVDGAEIEEAKTSVDQSATNPVINPGSQQAGKPDPNLGPKSPASEGVISQKQGLGLSPRSIDKQGQEQRNLSLVLAAQKLTAGGKYSSKVLSNLAQEAAANPPDQQTVYRIAQDTGVNPTYAIKMAEDSYNQSAPKQPTQLPEGYKVASEIQEPQNNAPDKVIEQAEIVKPEDQVQNETPQADGGIPTASTESAAPKTKSSEPPPLPTDGKAKAADPLQVKKDKLKKSFDQDTVNSQAQGIATATNAVDVLTSGVRAARSAVAGDTQGVVGNLKNAADIRQGTRNDQKIIAERKDEAETDKARWNSVVDKVAGANAEPLTDTEAVGAKRAFKRYDLPRKKAIADALGIENANDLTSDELNVEIDKLFDAKRPKSIDEEAKYQTIIKQHGDYVERTAGDKEGTFTPDEARSFKNDLRQLDFPDLAALAEKYGLNPTSSRNLLINQMKSIIDSKEEGRVKREKAQEGSASLLGTQVGRLRMGFDDETNEERPEAPIGQSQARQMIKTFGDQPMEDQKAILGTLGVSEEELANLEGAGLKDRFAKELQKHTTSPLSNRKQIQAEGNDDVADRIAQGMDIDKDEGDALLSSLPKKEIDLVRLAERMGVPNANNLGDELIRKKIKRMVKASIAQEDEGDGEGDFAEVPPVGPAPKPTPATPATTAKTPPKPATTEADIPIPDPKKQDPEKTKATNEVPADQKDILRKIDSKIYKMTSEGNPLEFGGKEYADIVGQKIPEEIGSQFDAHGTDDLGQLAGLLNGGVDKSRKFYSAPISSAGKYGETSGTTLKDNSKFIAIGNPGQTIREGGIAAVAVADLYEDSIPELEKAFPGTKFVLASSLGKMLPEMAGDKGQAVKYDGSQATEEAATAAEKPAKQVNIQGTPPAPKQFEQPPMGDLTSMDDVAREISKGDTVHGHIGVEHVAKFLKAYFAAEPKPGGRDKELKDRREKAFGYLGKDAIDIITNNGTQPNQVEAFLDKVASNIENNRELLAGTSVKKKIADKDAVKKFGEENQIDMKENVANELSTLPSYQTLTDDEKSKIKTMDDLRAAIEGKSGIAHATGDTEGLERSKRFSNLFKEANATFYPQTAPPVVSEGPKTRPAPKRNPNPKAGSKVPAELPTPEQENAQVNATMTARAEAEKAKAATDSSKLKADIEDFVNDHVHHKTVGARFDPIFEAMKKERPGLTKDEFKKAMQELHDDEKSNVRMGRLQSGPKEAPDQELLIRKTDEAGLDGKYEQQSYYAQTNDTGRKSKKDWGNGPKEQTTVPNSGPKPEPEKKPEPKEGTKVAPVDIPGFVAKAKEAKDGRRSSSYLSKKEAQGLVDQIKDMSVADIRKLLKDNDIGFIAMNGLDKEALLKKLVQNWSNTKDD